MCGFEQVKSSNARLEKTNVKLSREVEKVSFPPRSNTNMAHQLMCEFEQVKSSNARLEKTNVELSREVEKVSFPPRCNTNMAHQLMYGFNSSLLEWTLSLFAHFSTMRDNISPKFATITDGRICRETLRSLT